LIFLDLSYNSLGSQGGIVTGSSLLKNCCLETVNLSYNTIAAICCITSIAGIVENRTLKKLILDGNPIGDQV
jgi:Leucine-rich repeat (LRR) protein